MGTLIDGKAISTKIKDDLAREITKNNIKAGLAVILVGDNPASQVYVKNKMIACEKTGITSYEHTLPASASKEEIASLINDLNHDQNIHGILLQLPLPEKFADVQEELVQMISAEKDVDGLSIYNAGKLMLGLEGGHIPCTPQGSLMLIKTVKENLSGLHAVVIGRSNLFGKPMGQLLLAENCTVTQCHSRTVNLPEICRQADIVVAAVGRPKMVQADWVKEGAIVIDVGINRMEDGKLCGDVDFEQVKDIAGAITPVPGGVGPMTITCLLKNTVNSAKKTL